MSRQIQASDLMILRAVLHAGATPAEALAAAASSDPGGPLVDVGRAAAVGQRLGDLAEHAARDPRQSSLAPLLRVLTVAEATGSPSADAVDSLVESVTARRRLEALIRIRSADAVLTTRVLMGVPPLGLALTATTSAGARTFMRSAPGAVLVLVAGALMLTAWLWIRRLVRSVRDAARRVDPLAGGAEGTAPTADAIELLGVGLGGGLPLIRACALVADHGPPACRPTWRSVAASLQAGATPREAFGTTLPEVARIIEVTRTWGAPAAPALRLLRRDLHERAAAASEEAAERLTGRLVFPTTLLLVPAFALLVLPPILVDALSGVTVLEGL